MYFNGFVPLAVFTVLMTSPGPVTAAPAEAATTAHGKATFVMSWPDAGLTRYRFYFAGVNGVDFVHAFQNCGGITNNWQDWILEGHRVFDDSEVNGTIGAKVIACGVYAVTGQDCHSIGDIGC